MIKVSTIYRLPAARAHLGHCGICGVKAHLPWRDSSIGVFLGDCCADEVLRIGVVLSGVEGIRAPMPLEISAENNR